MDKRSLAQIANAFLMERHPDIHVDGPLQWHGVQDRTWLERIQVFRQYYYMENAPYLLNAYHRHVEAQLQMDETGVHFVVQDANSILGVLRIKLAPFEFAAFSAELAGIAETLDGCVELSRLSVTRQGRMLGAGPLLLASALQWALDEKTDSVVALCQVSVAKVFKAYGLQVYENRSFKLPQRASGIYHVMHGTWSSIGEAVEETFKSGHCVRSTTGENR